MIKHLSFTENLLCQNNALLELGSAIRISLYPAQCRIYSAATEALLPAAAEGTMVQHRCDSFTDNVTDSVQL